MKQILKLTMALAFSLFLAGAYAQTGNTGVTLDAEVIPKCYIDDTSSVSFFTVYVIRVGDNTPKVLGHFDQNGNTYTIPDTLKVLVGACRTDTTYDYEIVPKCDTANSTSFYTLILNKTDQQGDVSISKIGDYTIDGATYEPGANPTAGYCQSAPGSIDTLYDYEFVPKCDTANNESFYSLMLSKTITSSGVILTSKVGDYDLDGASYSPGANPTGGYCQSAPGSIDTLYDYEMVIKCDVTNEVGYFTLIEKKTVTATGVTTVSKVGDFDANGASYSPGGSTKIGNCFPAATRQELNILRFVDLDAGNVVGPANSLTSICISNVGFENGVINISGEPSLTLIPGETFWCEAVYDPTNNRWNMCKNMGYDATGTEFHVVFTFVIE